MNKNEFVRQVAAESGLSQRDAAAVDAVLATIEDALSSGDEVSFAGFGMFHVAQRGAREGRNPRTGESMQIAAGRPASSSSVACSSWLRLRWRSEPHSAATSVGLAFVVPCGASVARRPRHPHPCGTDAGLGHRTAGHVAAATDRRDRCSSHKHPLGEPASVLARAWKVAGLGDRAGLTAAARYAAVGGPNQVASASVSPTLVPSPTQAT
jgi:DNA-binding protein HU-beta